MNKASSELEVKESDHLVFEREPKKKCSYSDGSIWIRTHNKKQFLYAFKRGVLYKYSLSDNKSWQQDPMALQALKDFAQHHHEPEKTIQYYFYKKYGIERGDGLINSLIAAVRDCEFFPIDPIEGGWNFIFPRPDLFDYRQSDIGGEIFQKELGDISFIPSTKHKGVFWLRYCGTQKYAYLRIGSALIIYNASGREELWGQNMYSVSHLNDLFSKTMFPKKPEKYKALLLAAAQIVCATLYGHYGPKNHTVLQSVKKQMLKSDSWRMTHVKSKRFHPLYLQYEIATEVLKKRPTDRAILAITDGEGFWVDESIWVRKGQGKSTLCAWKNSVLFEYDLCDNDGWVHLPETLQFLQDFAQSSAETIDIFFKNNQLRIVAMQNACFAAVRDCLYKPVEMKKGWSLTDSYEGLFRSTPEDIYLTSSPVGGVAAEGSIWMRVCGHSCYLLARINGRLCQYNVSQGKAETWGQNTKALTILEKIFKSSQFLGSEELQITLMEHTILVNGTLSTICDTLYGDSTPRYKTHAWTISEPDALMFQVGFEEYLIKGALQSDWLLNRNSYTHESVWWRFDGEAHICFRTGSLLIQCNLTHACTYTSKYSDSLQDPEKKLLELLAFYHIDWGHLNEASDDGFLNLDSVVLSDHCRTNIQKMMQSAAQILKAKLITLERP